MTLVMLLLMPGEGTLLPAAALAGGPHIVQLGAVGPSLLPWFPPALDKAVQRC